jgi:iron complex outermembrane receptor protein
MQRFTGGGAVRPLLASLGVYVLLGLMTPVHAADAAADAPPARGDGTTVDTLKVTARRRSESIQTTPVSVTAISPAQLQSQAAPDIQDLEGLTPNLVIDPVTAGPSAAAISIRGISFEDIEKSFDPAVGVLIDGVYIGTNTGQLLDFFDFESVEVLRGPQGTLFGRNTTGGVINVHRSRPTGEFGGKVNVTFGDYGRQEFRGVLNLPKMGDVLSTKLFYFHREGDGFYHNVTRKTDEPHSKSDNYGVTLRFDPTENFDITLTAEGQRQRTETAQGSLSSSRDLICLALPLGPGGALVNITGIPAAECNRSGDDLYTTFSNVKGPVAYDEEAYTAEANWRVGGFTVSSVTGYRQSDESVRQDFDGSSINFFDTLRVQDYDQFSQELRIAGDLSDTIDVVAGVYYFDSSYHLQQTTNWGPFLQAAIAIPPRTGAVVDHKSRSTAAFADLDWKFADGWRLSVGGRYTKDKKEIVNNAGVFVARGSDSWSEFTPKVSVDYRPNDLVMLYGSYSRGFRSGGFNGRASTPVAANTPYDPESVDAYELGAKTQWFDNRLLLNVAVFETKYDNKQEEVVRPTPPGSINAQETIVDNAASATIKGVEVDFDARPVRNLSISGTLGVLDASYDEYRGLDPVTLAPLDLSNLNLRRTPKVTGSVRVEYTIPSSVGDWTLAASYRFVDDYDTTISRAPGTGVLVGGRLIPAENDPRGHTEPQDMVDASIAWRRETANGNLRASLFGRNLLDDRGLSAALPVAGLFAFGGARAPRTWGVELGYEF